MRRKNQDDLERLLDELKSATLAQNNREVANKACALRRALGFSVEELCYRLIDRSELSVEEVARSLRHFGAEWACIEKSARQPGDFLEPSARVSGYLPHLEMIIRGPRLGILSRAHIDALAITDVQRPADIQDILDKLWETEHVIGAPLDAQTATALAVSALESLRSTE